MDNTITALQNLYVALGGSASDVENLNIIPDMINAIATLKSNTMSTFYVDAVNGSDDNDGSSTAAFATIAKAIASAQMTTGAIINVAAGTYNENVIEVRGNVAVSVRGAAADTTIINGRFNIDRGAYLNIQNVTIAGTTTTSNALVWAYEQGDVYMSNCTLTPTTGNAILAASGSEIVAVNVTINGSSGYPARVSGFGEAKLRGCTSTLASGAVAATSGAIYIDNCTGITYTAQTQACVYVDGLQVEPQATQTTQG